MVPDHEYESCLNGIAYDPARGVLLLTGKKWPFIFEAIPLGALPPRGSADAGPAAYNSTAPLAVAEVPPPASATEGAAPR